MVAIFCGDVSRLSAEKEITYPLLREAMERSFEWLDQAILPIKRKLLSRYYGNSRFGMEDLDQAIKLHLVESILPNYSAEKGSFYSFFASVGWRRISDVVGANASHMTTTLHFLRLDHDDFYRKRAELGVLMSDRISETDDLTIEEYIADNDSFVDPHGVLEAKETLSELDKFINEDLSPVETAVFIEVCLNGNSYNKTSSNLGIDVKVIDNAVQRCKRKLLTRKIITV